VRAHASACAPAGGTSRPRHEVADIFRAHGDSYRAIHPLTVEQRKVMGAIESCRTAVLGGHMDVCLDCGVVQSQSYNSCRNRHCPKCQGQAQMRDAQQKQVERRMERVLPVHHFHVVFRLPGELRPVALRNQKLVYSLLFKAASQTLLTLGRDRLDVQLGVTAVLHTWTRDLQFHPHLHCIVTGGGLSASGERWRSTGPKYLFPAKVIGALFRPSPARVYRQRRHHQDPRRQDSDNEPSRVHPPLSVARPARALHQDPALRARGRKQRQHQAPDSPETAGADAPAGGQRRRRPCHRGRRWRAPSPARLPTLWQSIHRQLQRATTTNDPRLCSRSAGHRCRSVTQPSQRTSPATAGVCATPSAIVPTITSGSPTRPRSAAEGVKCATDDHALAALQQLEASPGA
jgi:hypothetical protein